MELMKSDKDQWPITEVRNKINYNKSAKNHSSGERKFFSTDSAGKIGQPHTKMKLVPYHTKLNSKSFKDKTQVLKLETLRTGKAL